MLSLISSSNSLFVVSAAYFCDAKIAYLEHNQRMDFVAYIFVSHMPWEIHVVLSNVKQYVSVLMLKSFGNENTFRLLKHTNLILYNETERETIEYISLDSVKIFNIHSTDVPVSNNLILWTCDLNKTFRFQSTMEVFQSVLSICLHFSRWVHSLNR